MPAEEPFLLSRGSAGQLGGWLALGQVWLVWVGLARGLVLGRPACGQPASPPVITPRDASLTSLGCCGLESQGSRNTQALWKSLPTVRCVTVPFMQASHMAENQSWRGLQSQKAKGTIPETFNQGH